MPFALLLKSYNQILITQNLLLQTDFYKVRTKLTKNATRCNNCDDLLHLRFTLKISIFSEAYM